MGYDGLPPNGMPFSRAAPIDRDSIVADSVRQNGTDLVDAQRRRLEWRVGPLYTTMYSFVLLQRHFILPSVNSFENIRAQVTMFGCAPGKWI
jgi:hypothetical protein